ncbi:methylated-DNA-[protein]-cysteine S-methyltransferase [Geomicrobium halophilum]|uniref:methylated-DNA--[protein]-cysteine S-methyltransferase n=1 Tax=Geomicrobium halophilum TaxID=549000 RepID=A0A841Q1D1_9BACL|nr:methylated-DNA--[protein]-cysteine S-methyltransferase [Geomicrobium halophilum]MBB6449628.1 methylated-DNA-[protein]-cysteine S-methyltransferase [Geomicrobium halophilum]
MGDRMYWSILEYGCWVFALAATEKGLCYVGSPNGSFTHVEEWAERTFKEYKIVEDDIRLQPYKKELEEYFGGLRESFTQPLDLHGTAFQREVWEILGQIIYGETYTYSGVAEQLGKPTALRAVASAIGANPVLIATPCHRVVRKNGSLSGYRGGLEMKRHLLEIEKEGVNRSEINDSG